MTNFKLKAYERGKQVACGCEQHLNSHVHTYFSTTDGISSPESMVDETAAKGFGGVAISDHGTMGGVLRAGRAAKEWKTGKFLNGKKFSYREVDLKKYSKLYTICDNDWQPIKKKEGKALVYHNPDDSKKFRLLSPDEFEHVGNFKAISGCELYVSWERFKDRKYHHVTVYATGMTGHRALVLLTSIGSTPSRRYTAGRGFFRPRVFMEDIELAVKEGGGEIIVTTGCPISIVSSALREGKEDEAREFFEWGKRVLEDGKFFAELHLCDVSRDFNRFYAKAEDKFWAAVSGTPVSRFRLSSESEALEHANKVSQVLRSVFCRSQSPLSVVSKSDLLPEIEVKRLLEQYRSECTKALVDEITQEEKMIEDRNKFEEKKAAVIEEAEELGKDVKLYLKKKAKDLKKLENAINRPSKLPDEDSIALIAAALTILEGKTFDKSLADDEPGVNLAKLVIIIAGETVKNKEDVEVVSILNVIQSMLSAPSIYSDGDEAKALLEISKNDSLYLDRVIDKDSAATETVSLAESWLNEVFSLKSGDEAWLNPSAASEDELEKEWIESEEGNWMEPVNEGIVRLAAEYDVPLLLATDAHMTTPDLIDTQDAIIKRGKRRSWHMSRPYAIPRADFAGFIEDTGAHHRQQGMSVKENCGLAMLEKKCFTEDDLIEAMGAGSLILDMTECAGTFKWDTVVPKIRYTDHKLYSQAKSLLESKELKDFLSSGKYVFSEKCINIATSIICVHYKDFVDRKIIEDNEVYRDRILRELRMLQEVGYLQIGDYFLVLDHAIHLFRDNGVSVGPGRGSAAGMLIAFICGITKVDPVKAGLSDSRFLTEGRKDETQPDIDVDVSHRDIATRVLAQIAADAMEESVKERPLTVLEIILHNEIFYSPEKVSHDEIGGMVFERKTTKKDLKSTFEKNVKGVKEKDENGDDDVDNDSVFEDADDVVFGAPIFRVGTYSSLKAKNAVKEAVRIADTTPFENLPSFADPPVDWKINNKQRLQGLSDEDINRLYESEHFRHLSQIERIQKRRIKLADHLTKAMDAGAGLKRLYKSEIDLFNGSVYGEVPSYWEADNKKPEGSPDAQAYFEQNAYVKDLVVSMLNIYKAAGVHAGGLCFGREALERTPLRCDGKGYVSQYEMADVERVGVLKFDILGISTLEQVSETLSMMVSELSNEELSWIPKDVYDYVKAGGSTDFIWDYINLSTPEAAEAIVKSRAMTFQIDTGNTGKDLNTLNIEMMRALASSSKEKGVYSKLTAMLDAVLALWRPGPMGVNAHLDFLKRLNGEPYQVIHPWLEPFVKETYGVIAYQEQVMAIYQKATGAGEDEVDKVRRAMGKKKVDELVKIGAQDRFINGCISQGVPDEIAKSIWESLLYFAEYGFNKAHSRCYAYITGVTLFLKAHYKEFFFRSIMGLAKSEDAGRFLAEISDVTRSPCALVSDDIFWRVKDGFYYPGLNTVEGLKVKDRERLLSMREGLSRDEVENLSSVDFFRRLMSTGNVTASFASSLSSSGLLRRLGKPKDIAGAYRDAVFSFKRKAKNSDSEAFLGDFGNELAPAKKKAPELKFEDEDELFAITYLIENQFFTKMKDGEVAFDGIEWKHSLDDESLLKLQESGNVPFYLLEAGDVVELNDLLSIAKDSYESLVAVHGKKVIDAYVKKNKVSLSKDEKLVYLALKGSNTQSVAGLYTLCRRTKIKGLGIKNLVSALYKERGGDWVNLCDLKSLKVGDQEIDVSEGVKVKTVAFLKAFSWVDGKDGKEPRFTLVADGATLNAKFSLQSYADKDIKDGLDSLSTKEPNQIGLRLKELKDGGSSKNEAIKTVRDELVVKAFDFLKDEKLTKPFEFTIFAKTFTTNEGSLRAFYRIEDVAGIG